MKILIVDDDQLALSILQLYLTEAGYCEVTACETSEHALALIEDDNTKFDCFFFDIIMPFIHGIDLCKRVRNIRRYEETPIIMLTSISGQADIDEAFAAGATDYVTKPFNMIEICARVRIAENLVTIRNKNTPKSSVSNNGECQKLMQPQPPISHDLIQTQH
jgi:DNA-binding response OmpR family regulator